MVSFSVVIPTRDRPDFLREAVASLLNQTLLPAEIIVADDGEGASAAVRGMTPLIRVLNNERRGPVAARLLGVRAASADCIAFLDDDDWLTEPGYFAAIARHFDNGADFTHADGAMVFSDGQPGIAYSFPADARSLERDNTILISAVAYRRSLHDRLGEFDTALPFYWDWDWYLRVARAGARLHHHRQPVVAIRVHARNMSGATMEAERRANLDRFAEKHGLPPLVLKNHLSLVREQPPGR